MFRLSGDAVPVVTLEMQRDRMRRGVPRTECVFGGRDEMGWICDDRVYRHILVGHDRGFDITDLQPLTVIRVNRVTVTVRTDEGSVFRILPQDIQGSYVDD